VAGVELTADRNGCEIVSALCCFFFFFLFLFFCLFFFFFFSFQVNFVRARTSLISLVRARRVFYGAR